MSQFDIIYNDIVLDIAYNGVWDKDQQVRTKWADGTPAYTKSIINKQIILDNSEVPILTTKRVPTKDPINEMFWIWKYKTNDVSFLREELNCHVWDEWEREDETIGKAYGWQLSNKFRKVTVTPKLISMIINGQLNNHKFISGDNKRLLLDQVDYLIYTLTTNPYSRRIKTTLWCVEDLDDMTLEPCVYETHWQVWNNKLHLTVNIRSNDCGLGNPYNVYQYAVLHRLIAQVTGHQVGTICFNIDNLHIYERHLEILSEQVKRESFKAPELWINPEVKSFYRYTTEDIKVINYQHGDKVSLEVAI